MPTSRRRPALRRRGQRGASTVELVMYMPLLMLAILLTVQYAMVYLGNQAANAVARETSRVARTSGDAPAAFARGHEYARTIGEGVLEGVSISIQPVGDDRVRVTVTGHAQKILPFGVPQVSETVEGPLEEFRRY